MSAWKTEKHFTSWLGLCPGTNKSGGRVLTGKTKRSANRAAAAFRIAASGVAKSKTALGAFYRRIKARAGAPKAIIATARKLAVLYYTMLKNGSSYVEVGQAAYEQRYRQRRFSAMQSKLLRWAISWCPREFLGRGSPQKFVANLWTEFAAHRSAVLATNGKEPQNPNKLVVAATFEKAKT